jgi:major membrane immunogen (membrane-anchored lipoprotein)
VQRAIDGIETSRDMDATGEEYQKASQRVRKAISKLRAAIEEGGAADHVLIVRGGSQSDPEYTLVLRFGELE